MTNEVSLVVVLYYVDSANMDRATREMIVCKQWSISERERALKTCNRDTLGAETKG